MLHFLIIFIVRNCQVSIAKTIFIKELYFPLSNFDSL